MFKINYIIIIVLIFIFIYIKSLDKTKIEYTENLTDDIFDKLLTNEIQILVIKNSYEHVDKLKNNILSLNKDFKKWEINNESEFDVNIIQLPLSNYFNKINSLTDYLNQEQIIPKILNDIESPMNIFKYNLKKYKTYLSRDPILNNSDKYQQFIIRKYDDHSIKGKNGLIHIDTDDMNLYNDFTLLSVNLYLNDFEGGELKYWKNFSSNTKIKPNKGDMIIINPSYYHSVLKIKRDNSRLSIQSFILINNNELYIRI